MEKESENIIKVNHLNFFYGKEQALKDISFSITSKKVTALIGPSGCGKSTFLRILNRMNDLIKNTKLTGTVEIDGENIYGKNQDIVDLRRNVGMVFQRANVFPMSIYDNIAFGLKINGLNDKKEIMNIVEKALIDSALWDEVKDILNQSAVGLSGGQQQRLCIARAIAVDPKILLMDEPTSALDPIATAKVEKLIRVLRENYTIVIVTHNMQQAARVSNKTAFFYTGELVEFGKTNNIFTNPEKKQTEDYISGKFG